MNDFKWEDLKIGHSEEFEVVITEEKLKNFSLLSGDNNPLHTDERYAHEKGHPGRVAHGLLTSSFVSRLVGEYLPGRLAFLQSVDLQFVQPVYIGDRLQIKGIIKQKNENFKQIELKVEIHNQKGRKVLRGNVKTGVLE